jgi:menaquinol-cytochrome c reductase iron-sulfur subunit
LTSWLGAAWAAVVAIPGIGFLLTPVARKAPSAERWMEFKLPTSLTSGSPVRLDFQTQIEDGWMVRNAIGFVYVVRQGEQLIAFSPTCTHLGCKVSWSQTDQRFNCPCHGGAYALDGSVIAGPPPRPLVTLPVQIEADKLRVEVSQLV